MRRGLLSLFVEGDHTVVKVRGDLDDVASDPLRTVLLKLQDEQSVVVDIADVESCDSSGIAVLASAAKQASMAGHELWVRRAQPSVTYLLRLTGCDWLLAPGRSAPARPALARHFSGQNQPA